MKKATKYTLAFIGGIIAISIIGLVLKLLLFPLFVAEKASETTHGVVEQTLNADNALTNYEQFKDLYNGAKQQVMNIESTEKQIQQLKVTYGEPKDWSKDIRNENSFLNKTLEGYKQQYQRTVSDYNSNASKLNRNLFKDKNLPSELPLDYSQLQ
ncbi:hypothetical protein [Lysinibacillus sp. Bpr_S20]|uniref:hypothetical protein n=1 Tax=Lysinibacillus sp. Bpr_S20 TaxID=2933964 RepID=UPI002011B053|nr:hypothetical protein [Lysinibacillus sp. Bpr_S20]MCL1700731.1 hypothetical protein [Lysinibacillus sp. Bpr_S20]